ncbi:cytochrome c biogenesis CcdA family protein [Segnochrobactrum spirostomi]|uniref:Cytochrome c biogenesis protein CcdA n=1 Tax=Segnochrobactrum spirostomi TaxID=2608987 RepID=A0A6A7XYN1_9HYPH|nr:cytochrome c biogenesis protein CcdA [Segnochrobactrum spirostomi]MQT11227.1 cytochrome c biogenesis protein CcdA [Segnochrobactrum spirostomi]
MAIDVGMGAALVGGILSFVSPCVLPLVPPYLCFMAGVSLDELQGRIEDTDPQHRQRQGVLQVRVLFAAVAFVLGFAAVFVTLGATASTLGQMLARYLPALAILAGAAILVMGLHFLGLFRIPLLYREARVAVRRKPAGPIGAFVMGLAFAFGWSPCIGPVLGSILFVAGSRSTALDGAALLAVYSLGLGIPFVLAAFFSAPFLRLMSRFRRHMGLVEKAMGALLVVTGILFLTGQMSAMSFWLIETFPGLATIG